MTAATIALALILAGCVTAEPAPTLAPAAIPEPQLTPTGMEPAAVFGGRATWYCSQTSPCTAGYGPSDHVAAIDPTLGIPKGTRLTVHHQGRSVAVTVVDTCACAGTRIVDLTSGAFQELAPLSVGVIEVAIETGGPTVTPPRTDR